MNYKRFISPLPHPSFCSVSCRFFLLVFLTKDSNIYAIMVITVSRCTHAIFFSQRTPPPKNRSFWIFYILLQNKEKETHPRNLARVYFNEPLQHTLSLQELTLFNPLFSQKDSWVLQEEKTNKCLGKYLLPIIATGSLSLHRESQILEEASTTTDPTIGSIARLFGDIGVRIIGLHNLMIW